LVRLDLIAEEKARAKLGAVAALVARRFSDRSLKLRGLEFLLHDVMRARRMIAPVLVLTTGESRLSVVSPIINPPMASTGSSHVAPPAAAMHSRKLMPMGTVSVTGSATAPAMVMVLCVTGLPSTACAMFTSVSTLFTIAPTWIGRPAGGMSLPVTV